MSDIEIGRALGRLEERFSPEKWTDMLHYVGVMPMPESRVTMATIEILLIALDAKMLSERR